MVIARIIRRIPYTIRSSVAVLQQMLSKAGREEFATLTVLTGIIVIIAMIIPQLSEVFEEIESIFGL